MAVCRYAVIRASSPTTARASSADPVADAADRSRFVEASRRMPARIRLFCLTLRWSGARISEVLALTPPRSISRAALRAFRLSCGGSGGSSGKYPCRRTCFGSLIGCSGCGSRSGIRSSRRCASGAGAARRRGATSNPSWRGPGIAGTPAMPKGLRHGFAVNALQSDVPPHLVQRWLGHASLRTTAIYGDVVGPEERLFAARMWTRRNEGG